MSLEESKIAKHRARLDSAADRAGELLQILSEIAQRAEEDEELWHHEADCALLAFIRDRRIDEAFIALPRWYA